MPDSAIPATPTSRHHATWWDRLAIVLLGVAGCALSYDALRQMATAVHVRHQLTYLFPVVIDGFIAYGVRALLVLREAPMPARLYAWTLFITATAASIWANGLHALDLNRPGTVTLHLGDSTVTVLSAIAPLALAGATHLHILITRYGGTSADQASVTATAPQVEDGTQPAPERATGVSYAACADPLAAAPPRQGPTPDAAETAPSTAADGTALDADHGDGDDPDDPDDKPGQQREPAGQRHHEHSGQPSVTNPGGRPAMASIAELATVISAAHPGNSGLTRDSARKAITDAGLGAGTDRLTEAIALAREGASARPHPAD
ncbi:DUF2637 domain-containing protein [Streptomyces sp. AD681]|uniref:DUF2637 domain-containing protein n=1 Tax=Streptomyces sp. AD681 TaxID=3019069 RepID=UPI0022F17C31|nr:DUF2637 domain-containing protein [Streptomyces sp. AD681]MDA5142276.1 DUF2637 domain-containing protein [Streptomyces sp. AD681]